MGLFGWSRKKSERRMEHDPAAEMAKIIDHFDRTKGRDISRDEIAEIVRDLKSSESLIEELKRDSLAAVKTIAYNILKVYQAQMQGQGSGTKKIEPVVDENKAVAQKVIDQIDRLADRWHDDHFYAVEKRGGNRLPPKMNAVRILKELKDRWKRFNHEIAKDRANFFAFETVMGDTLRIIVKGNHFDLGDYGRQLDFCKQAIKNDVYTFVKLSDETFSQRFGEHLRSA